MKAMRCWLAFLLFFPVVQTVAATFYVNVSNSVPVSPFMTWADAATNIQDAVDFASAGDLILVTNGIYKTGGRPFYGSLTNRLTVDKAVTVQSVNGPAVTIIEGRLLLGDFAARCAYLTNGATLSGFNLTNGATRITGDQFKEQSGAGVWCESSSAVLTNCFILNCSANLHGGGAFSGTLLNCSVVNNKAKVRGGGMLGGVMSNSLIALNTAGIGAGGGGFGGGVCSNTLYNCTVSNNFSYAFGGGAFSSTLNNCFVVKNAATNGGGAIFGVLNGCVISNNTANYGGGCCSNNLNNCLLIANRATNFGGGTFYCNVSNSVIALGAASFGGGGAYAGTLFNSVVSNNITGSFGGGIHSVTANRSVIVWNIATNLGGGAYGGTLTGCSLSNNWSWTFGGGVAGATASGCLIASNMVNGPSTGGGGGAYNCYLDNCLLTKNAALSSYRGGGTYDCALNNCTIVGNRAPIFGGGVYASTTPSIFGAYTNCIIYSNTASSSANYYLNPLGDSPNPFFVACCITPMPTNGYANFTNAPLFVDAIFHLHTNSPCINAGTNDIVSASTDYDGRPRIVGGTVDVGAYEFQGTNGLLIPWLVAYGLSADGTADFTDPDGDGMNNWREWIASTIPTNNLSLLKMLSAGYTNSPIGVAVNWQSVASVTYYLQRSTNLLTGFSSIQSNLVGQVNTTGFTDTTAAKNGTYFYRIGVQ